MQSMKLTFSLIITLYLTKPENKTSKISNTALILLLWVKVLLFLKNADFLQKSADISKIKDLLVLRYIFSETKYGFVLAYQISSSYHNSDKI